MPPKKKTVETETKDDVKEEKKEFRINAQTFALTYSQCNLSKERVTFFIKNKRPIEHIVTCKEYHKDGNRHLHVYVRFQQKLNIKKETFFDITDCGTTYHPNIQACKLPQNWYEYVRKDGNILEDFSWDFLSMNNYIKRKNDFESFKRDAFKRSLKECPKEVTVNNMIFKNEGKKRHVIIVSDPDWGKTEWIENTFEGYRVIKANKGKYPLDHYDGEEVILFDDNIPPANLILNISNVYKTVTPIGETRYENRYWPLYQQRWIFIMLNTMPEYMDWPNMKSRFHILDLRKHQEINTYPVKSTLDGIEPNNINF